MLFSLKRPTLHHGFENPCATDLKIGKNQFSIKTSLHYTLAATKLFVAGLAFASTINCTHSENIRTTVPPNQPQTTAEVEQTQTDEPEQHDDNRRGIISNFLEAEEEIVEIIHRSTRTFVLTDTKLLIFTPSLLPPQRETPNPSVRTAFITDFEYERINLDNILDQNIVSFAASEDTAFFLTAFDRMLVIRSVDSGLAERYHFEPSLDAADMIYHNGLLFMGPIANDLVIMSLSGGSPSFRPIPLGLSIPQGGWQDRFEFQENGQSIILIGNGQQRNILMPRSSDTVNVEDIVIENPHPK